MDRLAGEGGGQGARPVDGVSSRWARNLVVATTALFVLHLVWYLHRYSDFSNDDLDNFVLLRQSGFWKFILTPTDVHFVPLHRFLTWLVYRVMPMNFSVAIAILLGFHVGILVYLTRIMRFLQIGLIGDLLVCGYAASAVVVYGLVWWAHAQHRAPYVFLDVCAIYHYLKWMKSGKAFHIYVIALAFVAAFGFYEKAVLIPVHMFVIAYLSDEARFRHGFRKFVLPPFMLLFGSFAYVLGYLFFNPSSVKTLPLLVARADLEFVKVFFAAVFGLSAQFIHDVPEHGMSIRLLCTVLVVIAAILWSVWHGQGAWKVPLAALFVLMLDYLPIVLSGRIAFFGLVFPHQYRYFYEDLQIIVLFAGIWAVRMGMAKSGIAHRKWFVVYALVLVYAGVNINYLRAGRHQSETYLWVMEKSHRYLANIRAGANGFGGKAIVFENDRVPGYLSIFRITSDTRTLLPLFMPGVRFDDKGSPRYRVLDDGRFAQVQ